ncbi:glutaredoxin [bacterium]|nr:glutaredoxin [bacterium]
MSEQTLSLYHFPSCPYCQNVSAYIRQNEIEGIELKNIMDEPDFRQELFFLTGKNQVPCLVIDGEPMLESDDIIDWLVQNK